MTLTGHNLYERASGRINSTYPLKSVEKHYCYDYFNFLIKLFFLNFI